MALSSKVWSIECNNWYKADAVLYPLYSSYYSTRANANVIKFSFSHFLKSFIDIYYLAISVPVMLNKLALLILLLGTCQLGSKFYFIVLCCTAQIICLLCSPEFSCFANEFGLIVSGWSMDCKSLLAKMHYQYENWPLLIEQSAI